MLDLVLLPPTDPPAAIAAMLRFVLVLVACIALRDPGFAAPSLPLEPVPEHVTIERIDGTTGTAARAEPWPGGFVRLVAGNGKISFVPTYDIHRIRDENGVDATERVIRRWQGVGTGPVRPVIVDRPSPKESTPRDRPQFVVFQAGMLGRVNAVDGESNAAIAMDLGIMRNRSPRYALGGTLGLVGDEEYLRVALKPRLRRWMGSSLALDVAPGIFHAVDATGSPTRHGAVGFLLETSLIWGGLTATGQVEVIDRERTTYDYSASPWIGVPTGYSASPPIYRTVRSVESGTEASYQLGIKVGGKRAIPVGFVMLLALAVVGSTVGGEVY